jgi:hypothetical protein
MADESTEKEGEHVNTPAEEKLLTQIREDFRYVKEYWRENYEEAEKDMRMAACLPPVEFEEDRKGRPCIWPDEISQYVKQSNNNLRQNKRSAKISPRSDEAKDEDAEHRQAYIRGIEYASRAQSIYSTAFEACTECAFGFWRINCRVTGPNGEQEPRLVRIPNQFTVYLDPDAKERDFSDGNVAFVLDKMRKSVFARKYKDAKRRSFTGADVERAPDWFSGGDIVVAEYWTREEIKAADGEKSYKVTQYITNGVEILETNQWIGSWIPVIGVFGEEKYVRTGGQSKRMFLSLIRRAHAPQTMLAYIASQEAMEFGMAPQAPFMVIKGSVDPTEWKDAHRVPKAYLEYTAPLDWNAQQMGPVPPPSRPQFMPNAQAYQVSRESWRRAIQASLGLTPLPTSAQRQNEKSGIALEKIQDQEAIGSFHFVDNFVGALCNSTRQVNELITKLAELDSLPKQLLGKDQKDEDLTLNVVPRAKEAEFMQKIEERKAAQAANPASEHLNEADYFFAHRGQFEVTISDGPNKESEREDADEFADTIFQTVTNLAQVLPPGSVAKLLALAVRMKNIGSIGDEIADVLDPKDNTGQQLQQAQQQIAAAQQAAQEMQAELQKLKLERAGKVIENEYKTHVEQMRLSVEGQIAQLNADLKAYIANVQTKAQSVTERDKLFNETQIENHHAAHEAGQQASDQAHERDMAARNAVTAQAVAAAQPDQAAQPAEPAQGA